jgi:hypothetical protein
MHPATPPIVTAEPVRPTSKMRYGDPANQEQQAPTPRDLWLRGATDRPTPFVVNAQAIAPSASDSSAHVDVHADAIGAGDKPRSPNADSKSRDRRIAGQFGRINAPGKAAQGTPAPDKTPAAKSTKSTIAAGLWRRPLSPAD